VNRAAVLATGSQISAEDLSESIREERLDPMPAESGQSADDKPTSGSGKHSMKDRVVVLEIQMIREAMAKVNNDKRRAAKMLGLSLQGLLNKLKRYGLAA
jgi:DNA-binding NtrC family response regulator